MAKYTAPLPKEYDYRAEGSPERGERRELKSFVDTAAIPVIKDQMLTTSETGTNLPIYLRVEGYDKAEGQDSSLTKAERTFVPNPQKEAQTVKTNTPILIVEDTVELAEVIQATLEGMGLEAQYATQGKTGLELLRTLDPPLVILDIGLPDTTGWKMLDDIKEYYTKIDKPMPTIIVVTAYGDPANRLIGKLQNIHSYLIKPFTPDQVEKLVAMALRGEKPADPTVDGAASGS